MTPYVWKIEGNFWSHKRFPMVMFKPFGYSSKRTVLMFVTFWIWIVLALGAHYYNYNQSEKLFAEQTAANGGKDIKSEQFEDDDDKNEEVCLEHA